MDTSTRTGRQVLTSIDRQIQAHIRADRHGHVYKDRQTGSHINIDRQIQAHIRADRHGQVYKDMQLLLI